MRHYLLDKPLPRATKPLPQIWMTDMYTTGIDETRIHILTANGQRESTIMPREVVQALWEVRDYQHMCPQDKRELWLALLLRYQEYGEYVAYEPVSTLTQMQRVV